ncbi:DUF4342 domain-containing protein [Peptostreptococcus equinus]|uniref:DUF4342 domain-containing protein n=1 Tax=Peptostreptococcus equinus TaxID=3003601 RepID=A0ABY7JNW3_9FIRM|nr:DUF4342 domain-containing protein [Peptostreptococcus sp. CBA3647]WAW14174.1 DUF4342 domain-containing protein [Peptostreptococcus sp. CBA3647]
MAQITIEMVDKVLERLPYITYKEAKEALMETDGDVLEAIILIENKPSEFASKFADGASKITDNITGIGKVKFDKFEEKFTKDTEKVRIQLVDLFKEATVVRVVLEKEGKVMLNLPLTIGFAGVAFMPMLSILGISAAVLSKYSVKIVDENTNQEVDLGDLNPEKLEILKDIIFNSVSNIKDTVSKKDGSSKNDTDHDITDELFREDTGRSEQEEYVRKNDEYSTFDQRAKENKHVDDNSKPIQEQYINKDGFINQEEKKNREDN